MREHVGNSLVVAVLFLQAAWIMPSTVGSELVMEKVADLGTHAPEPCLATSLVSLCSPVTSDDVEFNGAAIASTRTFKFLGRTIHLLNNTSAGPVVYSLESCWGLVSTRSAVNDRF